MAKREWINKEHGIYRISTGLTYARVTIAGIGRKEIALQKRITMPIPAIDRKTIKTLIKAKDTKITEFLRRENKKPLPLSLIRFEDLAKEVIEFKSIRSRSTHTSAE